MGRLMVGVGTFVALAAGVGCEGTDLKQCTLAGCEDQWSVEVTSANGSFAVGAHQIEVTADGEALTCAFDFPAGGPGAGGLVPCWGPRLRVFVRPLSTCVEIRNGTSVGQQCQPIPGQFQETVTVTGTPASVRLQQLVDGAMILDRTATPSYVSATPNGPECGPVCRQAHESWSFE